MEKIIDVKQGFYHEPDCELTECGFILNQSEHDFRKVIINSKKELDKKGWKPCPRCQGESNAETVCR